MAGILPVNEKEKIEHVKGDLFSCPAKNSLAHCISEDCRMSAGIAAVFKNKFGSVQELLDQGKKSGEVAVLKRDDRYIYYLVPQSQCFPGDWMRVSWLKLNPDRTEVMMVG